MATISNGESGSSVRTKLNEIINKVEGVTSINNDVKLGDGSKAIFGAGSDLQIYHDGDNSYVKDAGTGYLNLLGTGSVVVGHPSSGDVYLNANYGGDVELFFNNSKKLETTATGVDVTGRAVVDGLTSSASVISTSNSNSLGGTTFTSAISGTSAGFSASITASGNSNSFGDTTINGTITSDGLTVAKGSEGTYASLSGDNAAGGRGLDFTSSTNVSSVGAKHTVNAKSGAGAIALATASTDRMMIDYNGDVSFYEDTGTTAKMVWDASAEMLTTSKLTVDDDNATITIKSFQPKLILDDDSAVGVGSDKLIIQSASAQSAGDYEFVINNDQTSSTDQVAIKISGNGDISFYEDTGTTPKFFWDASAESLGIGTDSPSFSIGTGLHIGSSGYTSINLQKGTSGGGGHIIDFTDASNTIQYRIGTNFASGGQNLLFAYGSTPTIGMTLNSSGWVGIGTSSPDSGIKLHVRDSVPFIRLESTSTSYNGFTAKNDSGNFYFGIDDSGGSFYGSAYARAIYADGAYPVTFYTNATEAMRIDSSGNLLVGTTSSPTTLATTGSVEGFGYDANEFAVISRASGNPLILNRLTDDGDILSLRRNGTAVGSIGTEVADATLQADLYVHARSTADGSVLNESRLWLLGGDNGIVLDGYTNAILPTDENSYEDNRTDLGSEDYRFKDLYLSGDTFVGEPSTIGAGETGVTVRGLGQIRIGRAGTAAVTLASFNNDNGEVGYILTNGSATTYATSSDYRLKEDVQPMVGASGRVLALNPVNFAWKVDGTRVDGFIAHEAQAVVPEAVTGEKDAVDAEGNPEYQGIDQSKLVPLLTAALQEALTEIADLKARVAALEA